MDDRDGDFSRKLEMDDPSERGGVAPTPPGEAKGERWREPGDSARGDGAGCG